MQDKVKEFRSLFIRAVERSIDGSDKVALMLSGGVDSCTVLAALLLIGIKPETFTFYLSFSESEDLKAARKIAKAFSLESNFISITRSEETLIRDIRTLAPLIKYPFKTHYQCSQPFLYLSKAAVDRGYESALFGISADDLYGTTKQIAIVRGKSGEDAARKLRIKNFNDPSASDYSIMSVSESLGLKLVDPFRDRELSEFVLALDMREIHRGKIKGLPVSAFPEFFRSGSFYRQQSAFQVNSGIRDWHDGLIKSKYNIHKNSIVTPIYKTIVRDAQ